MLEDPVVVSGFPFEMTDDQRKLPLLDRLTPVLTPNPHDAARGSPHKFPFGMAHRVEIHLPKIRPRLSGQVGQRLRIEFARHDPTGLHAVRVERKRSLDLDALGQQIRF